MDHPHRGATGRGAHELGVLPDHYPDRLTAPRRLPLRAGPDGPDSTVVHVEGDLKVHVPIVGRTVERVIVSGLRAYIEDEVTSIPDLAG